MLPALLFDLDGTIVDSARDIARALGIVSTARGGPPVDPAVVRPLVSLGAAVLVRDALGTVAGDPVDDLAAFRRVLADLPVDPTILYPGAADALATLAAAGHPMAIVTNKPEGLARALLAGLGIDRYFGAVVGGDTSPFAKPHRAPIDAALAAIGGDAARCLFIGDSVVDARAARSCGIPFLLFEGGYGADGCAPDNVAARFAAFEALPTIIEGILDAPPGR